MEALQMLKYALKKSRLNFMEGLLVSEADMLMPADDEVDLLARLVSSERLGCLDAIIAVLGQDED